MQNFIKTSAVVHELPCWQSSDDAENNTAVDSAGSNNALLHLHGNDMMKHMHRVDNYCWQYCL